MSGLISISATNFKALREAKVEFLNGIAAIVGRNGVGKSAMIDVLVFLRDCFKEPQASFSQRGENKVDIISNKTAGMSASFDLTFALPELLRHEIFYKWTPVTKEDTQQLIASNLVRRMVYSLSFNEGYLKQSLSIGPVDNTDVFVNILELISATNSQTMLKWLNATPEQSTNLGILLRTQLNPTNVGINFGVAWGFGPALSAIQLNQWITPVSTFLTQSISKINLIQPSRRFSDSFDVQNTSFVLNEDFSNLVQVIDSIASRKPELLAEIVQEFQGFLPHIEAIQPRSLQNAIKRTIAFYERVGKPLGKFFTMEQTSFGTKSILGFLTKVLVAGRDSIICVEEPELHLHPHAQVLLAKFFLRQAADKTLLITTHSPVFAAEFPVDSIYLAIKQGNYLTSFHQMGENESIRKQVIAELGIKPSHNFEANALILTEGIFDAAVYSVWAEQLEIIDVDFLDTEGWTNFRYYAAARMTQKKRLHTELFGILDGDTQWSQHKKPRKVVMEEFAKLGIPENVFTITHPHIEGFLLDANALVKMRAGLKIDEIEQFIDDNSGKKPKDVLVLCFEHFQLGYYTQETAKLLAKQFVSPPDEIKRFLLKVKAECEKSN